MTPLRWAVRAVTAVICLVLVTLLVVGARVWWVARHDDRRASDVIVVLGASQYDGRPSSVFTARLDHASELWAAKVAPRIVTVGGNQVGDRYTEAAAGKRWLVRHGVPSGRVLAVETGGDTLSSMRAVSARMHQEGWSTAVIVTDPWHALRTREMARDESIDAVTSPTRQGPAVRTRETEARYIARETVAYLYYKLFHRSADAGPRAV